MVMTYWGYRPSAEVKSREMGGAWVIIEENRSETVELHQAHVSKTAESERGATLQ